MDEKKKLTCPLCQATEFSREEGRVDSKFDVTSHKVDIFICKKCNHILFFGKGRTIWDFD